MVSPTVTSSPTITGHEQISAQEHVVKHKTENVSDGSKMGFKTGETGSVYLCEKLFASSINQCFHRCSLPIRREPLDAS